MTTTSDPPSTIRPAARAPRPVTGRPRQWWVPLFAVYCVGFAVFGGYRYVAFDSGSARIPTRTELPYHYPILALHVLTGAIAVALAWMQVWPWLRETYPTVHRWIGRTYFFAGVFPSAILAYPAAVLTMTGQTVRIALLVLAVLWTGTAIAGYRATRQGRYEDHRRWMLRNVALTTVIITSRLIAYGMIYSTPWLLPETYSGAVQENLLFVASATSGHWAAMLLHLLFVEWWLLRPRRGAQRPARPARRVVAAPTPAPASTPAP